MIFQFRGKAKLNIEQDKISKMKKQQGFYQNRQAGIHTKVCKMYVALHASLGMTNNKFKLFLNTKYLVENEFKKIMHIS